MKGLQLLLLGFCIAYTCAGQTDPKNLPDYVRFPGIPKFTIYRAPDSSVFTRSNLPKKPVVFMVFDPDCEHCQVTTKDIISKISKFKKLQIVMVTYLGHAKMLKFYKDFGIAKYPVITMGSDPKYFFPMFFKVRNLPAVFIYNKDGKYKTSFAGTVSADKIISSL